ncbi:ras GEF [Hymenopellis radicata]|nr:ras GEF [Hymenopellis radicata]
MYGQQTSTSQSVQHELMDDFPTLFCRALYDYDAQDASALSFRRGDIIEVLTQQASGWWDGLLGEERGWFPSNYVTIISDEEAELAFSGSDASNAEVQVQSNRYSARNSIVDMSHAMMRGSQEENEEWLDSELSSGNGAREEPVTSTWDSSTSSSDFWMPQVAPNGQIFYVNTKTGQQSRDLPQEAEDDISDPDIAALTSQTSTRSGTSASLGFGANGAFDPAASDSDTGGSMAGFGLPRRSGTPEPWIRKLADDGMSYFYLNTVDGQANIPRMPSPVHLDAIHETRRLSVYSDSSDILDPSLASRPILNGHLLPIRQPEPSQPPYVDTLVMELTAAERLAQSLQQALSPPPPELLTDLSAITRAAIQDVVDNVQRGELVRRQDEDDTMEELVHAVVLSVRNLLYISAAPTGQIPPNVLHPNATHPKSSSASPLKPAQRKVTATLSRLVLSARAMQYDSGSSSTETLNRIEVDADEVERAVLAFVLEVQRMQHSAVPESKPPKRLKAVFSTANIGLGLVGAGAAGSWEGFGWVSSDDKDRQPETLSPEVTRDASKQLNQLDISFSQLSASLRSQDVTLIIAQGRDLISLLASYLAFVGGIHIARHVDIDGIRQESNHRPNDLYIQTVVNARLLVRTLECAVQAAFDDGASLLASLQSWHSGDTPHKLVMDVDSLLASINDSLTIIQQALDSLLAIGNEQSELGQNEYRESITRRLSRLSQIDGQLARKMAPVPKDWETFGEDVVDMDYAFSKPAAPKPSGSNGELSHRPQPSVSQQSAFTDRDQTIIGDDDDDSTYPNDERSPFDDDSPRLAKPQGKSKDLSKLLGPGFQNGGPPLPEPVPEPVDTPWYLLPNYDPEEILIDSDNSIKGGTVPALVERLTAHEFSDPTYVKTFMMTFKSFTTVEELFDILVERFRIQPPPELTSKELETWGKLKQHVIQMRVLNIFKTMVTDEDILDKEDMHILERIRHFVLSDEVSHFAAAKQLLLHIDRAKGGDRTRIVPVNLSQAPPPIVPKSNKKLKLLDIEPLEMARQLTIMESTLFQRIKPIECLQRAREQKTEATDNITVCIHASNRIADWVADSVLNKDDSRRRANTVKHLISIADRCRTLNNFSTMIAITSGLNTPPIRRLKRTWEQVSQRYMAQFGACEMTIDSNKNFTKYRQLMATVTPPCVPFIGVFLSTLQFIQDGNPDTLPGGLVNFRKRQRASEVISDIQRWQAQSFNFQSLPNVQDYIQDSLSQFNDTTKATSDMFWALSLEREPREREDEKMARLLQESGFL